MSAGPLRQAVGIPTSALAKDFVLPGPPAGTMPKLIYGTAWKEARTADLVYLAIKTGFRGIDTAAQPRHYREDLVGEGIRRAISEGIVSRKELYIKIQTKYTPTPGQDLDRMPYNAADPIPQQIHTSITSSLRNLATGVPASRDTAAADGSREETGVEEEEPYLDALLLHAPFPDEADTLIAWKALAAYVPHPVRRLGISNASPRLVAALMDSAVSPDPAHRPVIVQNRFFDVGRFGPLRKRHTAAAPDNDSAINSGTDDGGGGVIFQSFHTLSLPALTQQHPAVRVVARGAGVEPHAALYALLLGLGGTAVLDGTRDAAHMRADLEGVEAVGRWAAAADGAQGGRAAWARCVEEFRATVREEA